MCPSSSNEAPAERRAARDDDPPFPWHLGACDAHCHPTDEMASISRIESMRTRALTVMATRGQDQELVAEVASGKGFTNKGGLEEDDGKTGVVASFGWHPWFSHQLYDDTEWSKETTYEKGGGLEAKRKHYQAVLAPSPQGDEFINSLPEPKSLQALLDSTREYLKAYPTALVGEIGLDKAFRLPAAWSAGDEGSRDDNRTPGGREGRLLSPHRTRPAHQQAVLEAQLRLAGEMGRAVSVHGVQAHGVLLETVARTWKGHEKEVLSRRQRRREAENAHANEPDSEDDEDAKKKKKIIEGKPFPPRICLHSFSASPEILKQWLDPSIPAEIFYSFSVAVNMGTNSARSKVKDVIRGVPDGQILVESDWHAAGEEMEGMLEEMYRVVCDVKGWDLEDGVRRIRANYERFIFGNS